MPRSVRDMSNDVFEKFDKFVEARGFPARRKTRYISYTPDDVKFPANAKLTHRRLLEISPSQSIAVFTLEDECFIFDIGSIMITDGTSLNEIDIECGHAIALLNLVQPNIPNDRNVSKIRDAVTEYDVDSPGYGGHDYRDLLIHIQPTRLYCLDMGTSIFEYEILTSLYNHWAFLDDEISDLTKESVKDLVELPFVYINFFNYFNRLLISHSYEEIFMSLYRCYEKVMNVDYYLRAIDSGFTSNYDAFIQLIEEVIGIRPREMDALESLFSRSVYRGSEFKNIASKLYRCSIDTPDHKIFYSLRNTIVHGKEHNLDPSEWDKVIYFSSRVLLEIVNTFTEDIFNGR